MCVHMKYSSVKWNIKWDVYQVGLAEMLLFFLIKTEMKVSDSPIPLTCPSYCLIIAEEEWKEALISDGWEEMPY